MATLSLEQLAKTYRTRRGDVRAVDALSVDIADEELIVLVGPSGCGKTTTLRMIAGLETPTAGTIRIDDRMVNDIEPKDRDIAMVFQHYALYPHMTVYDNMAFGLKMRKVPKAAIRVRVGETAELLGMAHLLDRKPKMLSGGEKQRVAVGRAIVRNPKVFLFDEPLSNLDARLRVHMRTELKALQRRLRTTAIYVTHDHEEAMILGDRLVVMKEGRVQQVAAPQEVYDHPANRFVAGFLGTPAMNFIEGELSRDGGGAVFRGAGVSMEVSRHAIRSAPNGPSPTVLGIRPEHVAVCDQARGASGGRSGGSSGPSGSTTGAIPMRVRLLEPLGERVNVHLETTTGLRIVARTTPDMPVRPGETCAVTLRTDRVHLFAPGDRGENLAPSTHASPA